MEQLVQVGLKDSRLLVAELNAQEVNKDLTKSNIVG